MASLQKGREIISPLMLLVCMTILFSEGMTFSDQLSPLQQLSYDYLVQSQINMTINEQIRFSLPEIDSSSNQQTLASYSLSELQYYRFVQLQKSQIKLRQQAQIKNTRQQEQKQIAQQFSKQSKLSENDSPLNCIHRNPQIQIRKTYSSLKLTSLHQTPWESLAKFSKIYKLVSSRSLLYSLNPQTMTLQAFHYNEMSLTLLSSHTLLEQLSVGNNVAMQVNADSTILYIFTKNRIYSVDILTVLTQIRQLQSIGGLYPRPLDKVICLSQGRFVGLKKMDGIYVFKQDPHFLKQDNATSIRMKAIEPITKWKQTTLIPQDIYIEISTIYVLDLRAGVFIFTLLPDGRLQPEYKIELQTQGNFAMTIKQSSIIIAFNDLDGSKLAQLHHNRLKKRGQLVRYYKSNTYIQEIYIYEAQTTSLHSRPQKEFLLFSVADENYLQIHPYNKDPRMIPTLDNGGKLQVNKLREVYHIFGPRYIIVTEDEILYVKLSIEKPQLICTVNQRKSGVFRLSLTSDISTCQNYQPPFFKHHKKFYHSTCKLTEHYLLQIIDPEANQFNKAVVYGIVVGFIIAFLSGILCLIQWRNNKLIVLQRLKDQIMRFRNRAKRMQPYILQQQKSDEVEIEVPKIQSLRDDVEVDEGEYAIQLPDLNDSN